MAASDSWQVIFRGTGGHGAMPHAWHRPYPARRSSSWRSRASSAATLPPPNHRAERRPHPWWNVRLAQCHFRRRCWCAGRRAAYTPRCRRCSSGGWPRSPPASPGRRLKPGQVLRQAPSAADQRGRTDQPRRRAAALTVGRDKVDPNTPPITGAGGFRLHAGEEARRLHHDRQRRAGRGGCHYVHSPLYDFNDGLTTGAAYWLSLVQLEAGRRRLIWRARRDRMQPDPGCVGAVGDSRRSAGTRRRGARTLSAKVHDKNRAAKNARSFAG